MNTYYIAGYPVSDELYHHGILGQKWGVRRWQNKDGSLTSAGREKYLKDSDKEKIDKYTPSEKDTNAYYKKRNDSLEKSKDLKNAEDRLRTESKALMAYKDQKSKSIRDFIPNRFDKKLREHEIKTTEAFKEYTTAKALITDKLEQDWAKKTLKSIGVKDTQEARNYLITRGWLWT